MPNRALKYYKATKVSTLFPESPPDQLDDDVFLPPNVLYDCSKCADFQEHVQNIEALLEEANQYLNEERTRRKSLQSSLQAKDEIIEDLRLRIFALEEEAHERRGTKRKVEESTGSDFKKPKTEEEDEDPNESDTSLEVIDENTVEECNENEETNCQIRNELLDQDEEELRNIPLEIDSEAIEVKVEPLCSPNLEEILNAFGSEDTKPQPGTRRSARKKKKTTGSKKKKGHSTWCRVCGLRFPSRIEVEEHGRETGHELRFACQYCGRRFKQRIQQIRHEDQIHNPSMPYECRLCGRKFKNEYSCKRHEENVTMHQRLDRPIQECYICGKKLARRNKWAMKQHMRTHPPELREGFEELMEASGMAGLSTRSDM